MQLVPLHNDFSPTDEQPEQHKSARTLQQRIDGCGAVFHKFYCYTNTGVL